MFKALLLSLCFLFASTIHAAPTSNGRVGGGMLMFIGGGLAVGGLVAATQPDSSAFHDSFKSLALGAAVTGVALGGLGTWLWIRAGERQEVALSYRF